MSLIEWNWTLNVDKEIPRQLKLHTVVRKEVRIYRYELLTMSVPNFTTTCRSHSELRVNLESFVHHLFRVDVSPHRLSKCAVVQKIDWFTC